MGSRHDLPQVDVPPELTQILIIGTFFAAVLFMIIYTLKAPWWQNSMGQNMFALDGAIALVLLPGVLHYLFGVNPDTAFYQWFEVCSFALAGLTILHRLYVLFRVQPGWLWQKGK